MTEIHAFDTSLQTIAPFPNIFSQYINQHGFLESTSRSNASGNYTIFFRFTFVNTNKFNKIYVFIFKLVVAKSTAISGLHNSNSSRDMIIELQADSSKVKGSKLSHIFNYGIDVMDYKETLENLLVLSDNYLANDCL